MIEASIERRAELISQAKVGKLSVAEIEELKSLLENELRHDLAAGKIGLFAFIILLAFIRNLPHCAWGAMVRNYAKPCRHYSRREP